MRSSEKIKSLITLIGILIINIGLQANTKYIATGQVKDIDSKQGLMFCTVGVYSLTDSLISGAATDENGFFNLPLENGNYRFTFSYTGYTADSIELTIDDEDVFLGTIKLKLASTALGEITLKVSTNESRIDRNVQMVTKTMRVGSINTNDVLGKLNGVSLDRYNKTIKVDGSDKVVLLLNGLEKDQEYIKNISPERIKEIEIIRNPSGRYALEGYTAVLNIKLKTDYTGSEVLVSGDTFLDPDSENTDYIRVANSATINFNYTHDKLNLYGKASNNQNNFFFKNTIEKQYGDQAIITSNTFNNDFNMTINRNTNNYTFGVDYNINPKHTISFESNLESLPFASDVMNMDYNVTQFTDGVPEDYISNTYNNYKFQNLSATLFYTFRINENNNISTDFTYSQYNANYTNKYAEASRYNYSENGEDVKNNTIFNLEYEHIINKKSTITAGYGNNWREINNSHKSNTNITLTNAIVDADNKYSSSESRNKFYAYYFLQLSKSISFKAGLASEFSHPKFDSLEKTYTIYQPYLDIKYDLNENVFLKFKYRVNSKYPRISQALPFKHQIDQFSTETGNPYIKPEIEHNYSFEFNAFGALSVEPYYKQSSNKIVRSISLDDNGSYNYTYSNTENFVIKGIKGNITLPLVPFLSPKPKLLLQSGFDFYKSSITYQNKTHDINDWVTNSALIYINEKQQFIGALIYQKNLQEFIKAQGVTATGIDYWMLFAQKSFMDESLNVNIGYVLPVDFGVGYEQTVSEQTKNYQHTNSLDISMAKNVIMLGVSYRFNKGEKIKRKKKAIDIEVERESNGLF